MNVFREMCLPRGSLKMMKTLTLPLSNATLHPTTHSKRLLQQAATARRQMKATQTFACLSIPPNTPPQVPQKARLFTVRCCVLSFTSRAAIFRTRFREALTPIMGNLSPYFSLTLKKHHARTECGWHMLKDTY